MPPSSCQPPHYCKDMSSAIKGATLLHLHSEFQSRRTCLKTLVQQPYQRKSSVCHPLALSSARCIITTFQLHLKVSLNLATKTAKVLVILSWTSTPEFSLHSRPARGCRSSFCQKYHSRQARSCWSSFVRSFIPDRQASRNFDLFVVGVEVFST